MDYKFTVRFVGLFNLGVAQRRDVDALLLDSTDSHESRDDKAADTDRTGCPFPT